MQGTRGHRRAAAALGNRVAAWMYLAGAGTTALALLLPHPAEADVAGYLGVIAAQLAIAGALMLPRASRLSQPVVTGAVIAGLLCVSAAVYFDGERMGGPSVLIELFYVWIALYAGYFCSARQIAVSIAATGAVYGSTLAVTGPPGNAAPTRWVVVVAVFAVVTIVVHRLRLHNDGLLARLAETARTDALTGLLNRRAFAERFEAELERARRTRQPVALVIADLDHFKRVNDRHGHAAGDVALERVARALEDTGRSIDVAARIGGEEFALLLPETSAEGARSVAERLRSNVAIVMEGFEALTLSCGIAEFPLHGPGSEALFQAADRALYTAKDEGRDRVEISAFEATSAGMGEELAVLR